MSQEPIAIISAKRTPIGAFQGQFSPLTCSELGQVAIQAAYSAADIAPETIEEVLMGCVLPAGQGQAPARQAALKAGLPDAVTCTTINKMCGSGMKTVMMAMDSLWAGSNQLVCAGGMESMTNAPYLLPKAREGYRMGHQSVQDHMFLDGLEDAYDKGKLMGVFAEQCADKHALSRQAQDDFAIESLSRAQKASQAGAFDEEMAAVTVKTRKSEDTHTKDECPQTARPDKIPQLKPAFRKDGTVTAANASGISDGAAALLLAPLSYAKANNLPVMGTILAHATHAHAPEWFTTAPIGAIEKVLGKVGWTSKDVDLFEINEAFAVVTLAAIQQLSLSAAQVNIHGGACALGHPIGASGARIIVTLLHALKQQGLKKGIAALCIGGGEGTALAIEAY